MYKVSSSAGAALVHTLAEALELQSEIRELFHLVATVEPVAR